MRHSRAIALIAAAAALPSPLRAADFQVTSSTQILGYSDFLSPAEPNQGSVAQYLRLNVVGLDDKNRYNIYGYGRVVGQFTGQILPDGDAYGRLYYLYLDARDVIPDHFDLKLGRTYVPQSAITSTVDGGYVNARNLGLRGLGLTAFGGHKVTYDNLAEVGNADDLAAGGSVYVDLVRRTHLEASYARKWIGGDYAQDFASLDVNTVPFAFLGLTGRAKYDLGESRWAELLAGVSLTPFDPLEIPLVIKGEVIVERPSFDQFSFYRYFGVARYQEFGGALEYEVLEGLRLNARYAYENFAGANDDVDQHANVIEAGASFRRVRNLVVNASFLNRNGFGARLSGLRLNAAYALGKLGLLAGIDYDDFRRDLARTDTSKRYWAGANYEINKNFTVSVHGEDDISYLFTHTLQGVAALVFHL